MTVKHHTFSTERTYPAPVPEVFAAWADQAAKGRWFAGEANGYTLDFRVGGLETLTVKRDTDVLTFQARYADIVPDERIVFSSTLCSGATVATVAVTTVELAADGDGTRLVLVEQDTFLDDQEQPEWRETGTNTWLDALGTDLAR